MKFDPWAASKLAVGDRNGSALERVHTTRENTALAGHCPCPKLLIELYDIGGRGRPYKKSSSTLESHINGPRGDLSLSDLLP